MIIWFGDSLTPGFGLRTNLVPSVQPSPSCLSAVRSTHWQEEPSRGALCDLLYGMLVRDTLASPGTVLHLFSMLMSLPQPQSENWPPSFLTNP